MQACLRLCFFIIITMDSTSIFDAEATNSFSQQKSGFRKVVVPHCGQKMSEVKKYRRGFLFF